MISKNKAKFIISLQKKKIRDKERLFIIEGDKLVKEFLYAKNPIKTLIAIPEFLNSLPADLTRFVNEIEDVSYEELKHISSLITPHNALAIIPMPDRDPNITNILKRLSVALDFVQDPGNLGTIIRTASWFGIKDIVCSEDCVDVYNPKVIQASMGAILHVNVYYSNLKNIVIKANDMKIPVFGTMLEGESIYNHKLDNKGIILLGNESKGISDELMPFITEKIMIPGANKAMPGIESLNVGMAASVIFSEFFRRASHFSS
ncbi:MAG TPA: RNA methyltransferase [Bacteroidales bacterium]|nr:RNA methyltransferase [Bacteroidales bacterium]